MSLRCWLGIHMHGIYAADRSYEPVVHLERCPRCGRILSTEPPTRGYFFHEAGVDRARCPDAIDVGDGARLACPGHVLGENGKQVATMRPLVLQRLADRAEAGSAEDGGDGGEE